VRTLLVAVVSGLAACGGGSGSMDGGGQPDLAPPPLVWPNAESAANSDPWIVAHHQELREMHPRVLALNFVNGRTNADMEALIGQIFAGLKEGSRYHGYTDPAAPPFLIYEIAKSVDLTDHPPPANYQFHNSTLYPRKSASSTDYWHFDYAALFNQQFADYYGFVDPQDASHYLTLCELFERGVIHELWIYGDADVPDVNAAEVLENKQMYDAQGNALAGQFDPCAGNGCFDQNDIPACKVSLRIPWVNNTRGPGCLIHSIGHGFEGMSRMAIPTLTREFAHFGNFDFQARLGVQFNSWYALCTGNNCLTYSSPNSVAYAGNGLTGSIAQLDQGCGNVHFPPNARDGYDDQNPFGVLSTCEHYGLGGGAQGTDQQELYTDAKSQMYDALAPDCEGGWQVYWRQSFPGRDNPARNPDGTPIKSWWPYEFY
jgi:hypothetical protein